MTNQNREEKRASLMILEQLYDGIKNNDTGKVALRNIINEVKAGTRPHPVKAEDWAGVCTDIGVSPDQLRYRKILSIFSAEQKEHFQHVKRSHLKLKSG